MGTKTLDLVVRFPPGTAPATTILDEAQLTAIRVGL